MLRNKVLVKFAVHTYCILLMIVLADTSHVEAQANESTKSVAIGGLVIAKLKTAIPDPDSSKRTRQSALAQYQIIRVLQPPDEITSAPQLSVGGILSKKFASSEDEILGIPLIDNLSIEFAGKLLLLQVGRAGSSFTVSQCWIVGDTESGTAEKIEDTEINGLSDITKVTSLPTDQEAAMFLQIAQTTKHPSLVFALAATRFVQFRTPRLQRYQIVQALATLLERADAPIYVRKYSYQVARGLAPVQDEDTARVLLSSILIKSFHEQIQQTHASNAFVIFLLSSLQESLRYVVADPQLKHQKQQLTSDLHTYEDTLLVGSGKVIVTHRQINGATPYEYSGPVDKVRVEAVIRPLLDMLGTA